MNASVQETILKNMISAMVAVRQGAESAVKAEMPGVIDNLDGTIFLLKKILKSNEPKTIGFFGAQKRGKSSIINYLLGVDLMPTGPIPMSSVIVRVKHDSSLQKGCYNIDITSQDGQMNSEISLPEASARSVIELYGSHRGDGVCENVDTIEVASNFAGNEILENGGILVDTPGAEMAFSDDRSDARNDVDSQRAVEELKNTHLVVFVERADYLEAGSGYQFFSKQIKQLRPLSVVSFKDKFNVPETGPAAVTESIKQQRLGSMMMKVYGINLERFACVSCLEAESDKDLSGMPSMTRKILKELSNLGFENGLRTSLVEFGKNLKLVADNLGKDVARRIFMPATVPFSVMKRELSSETGTETDEEKFRQIAVRIEEILNDYRS